MAFASVGSLIADNSTTSNQASWTTSATLGNALAAGNLGVLVYAIDNFGTLTGSTDQVVSAVDSAGNHWLKADEYTFGGNSAGTLATVSVWWCIATSTLSTSGTITFTHARTSASIVSKAVTGWVYTFGAGKRVAPRSRAYAGSNTTAPSMSLSSLPNVEHLFVRGIAREGSGIGFTGTTNYTSFTSAVANSGTTATSMLARGEWRILTATGDTSAPTLTTGGDQANLFVDFVEFDDTLLYPRRVLDASGTTFDATSYTTGASIAPAADTLVLLWVASRVASGTPSAPAVSGASLSWSLVASSVESGAHIGLFCFAALAGASPGSGSVTFDYGAVTQTLCQYSIEEYDGFASYSVVQSATGSITSATTLTLTLASLANASNATLGGFFSATNTPGYGQIPANNAPVGQFSQRETTDYTIQTSWRYDGNTTVALDASVGNTTSSVGIALEIGSSISGEVNVTLGSLTSSGTGALTIAGTGNVTLDQLTASAVGTLRIGGDVNATLDALTSSGTGTLTIAGTGNVTLGQLTASAVGTLRNIEALEIFGETNSAAQWSSTLEASTLESVMEQDGTNSVLELSATLCEVTSG